MSTHEKTRDSGTSLWELDPHRQSQFDICAAGAPWLAAECRRVAAELAEQIGKVRFMGLAHPGDWMAGFHLNDRKTCIVEISEGQVEDAEEPDAVGSRPDARERIAESLRSRVLQCGGGRPEGREYTKVFRIYETDEGAERVRALARRRGLPVAAFLRQLVLEEAVRVHRRDQMERSLDVLTPEDVAAYERHIRDENPEDLIRS